MKIYIFTLIGTLFFSKLVEQSNKKHIRIFYLILLTLFLVLLSGLRVDATLYSDEWNYRYSFVSYIGMAFSQLDFTLTNEPAFSLLNWILANTFGNAQSLIFFCSLLTNISFVRFIYKHSNKFSFSMFLYISSGTLFTSWNIIRQYVAISIVLLFFDYILDKKLLKFLIVVFVAFLFHKSAIIMIFIYIMMNSKLIENYKFISFGLTLFIMFNFNQILLLFDNSLYGNYVSTFQISGYGVGAIRTIWWLSLYTLILWKKDLLIKRFNIKEQYFNYIMISVCITMLSTIYVFIARLDYLPIQLLIVPMIPYCFHKDSRKIVNYALIFLFFLYGAYSCIGMTQFSHLLFGFL